MALASVVRAIGTAPFATCGGAAAKLAEFTASAASCKAQQVVKHSGQRFPRLALRPLPAVETIRCYVPVPVKGTVWGLPPALSVKDSAALRAPVAEGVKVTVTVQLCLGASDVPHVVPVWVKSPALLPV